VCSCEHSKGGQAVWEDGSFFSRWVAISFSRRTLLHQVRGLVVWWSASSICLFVFLLPDACFVCAVIHCGTSWICYQAIFWLSDPVPAIAVGRICRTQHASLCYRLHISTFSKGMCTLCDIRLLPQCRWDLCCPGILYSIAW